MNIDSFVGVPLLIAAGLGVLLFLFLLIIRVRNTATPSFIYYIVTGVIVAGSLYIYFNQHIFYLTVILILAEFLLLPYSIVMALTDSQKREEKRQAKKAQESKVVVDSNSISREEFEAEKERGRRIVEVNKELIEKVSQLFANEGTTEAFLDYCNQLLMEKLSADGCVILMADEFDNILAVKSFSGTFPPPYKLPDDLPHKPIRVETNLKFAQFQLSGNIFGDVATGGESVLVQDSVKEPRIYQNGPEDFLRCGSYIFVPIKQQEGVTGVIALSRNPGRDKFTKENLMTAEILTDAISTAMRPLHSFLSFSEHKKLTRGGDIATAIQKDLSPAKLPVISGLGIGCFSIQAENVCGDYYDVIIARKDRISFIMADVAGKGMNSLVIMLMIRAILRLIVNTPQSAATILSWANRGICNESTKIDHFASVALINYNPETRQAQIATCGNNIVFVYTAKDKEFKQISISTEPMGVEKETSYQDVDIQMNSGDIIVACTDGVIESLNDNGTQYSADNLKRVVLAHANDNAKDISNRVKDDLKKFIGTTQQYDDTSLIVVKVQ